MATHIDEVRNKLAAELNQHVAGLPEINRVRALDGFVKLALEWRNEATEEAARANRHAARLSTEYRELEAETRTLRGRDAEFGRKLEEERTGAKFALQARDAEIEKARYEREQLSKLVDKLSREKGDATRECGRLSNNMTILERQRDELRIELADLREEPKRAVRVDGELAIVSDQLHEEQKRRRFAEEGRDSLVRERDGNSQDLAKERTRSRELEAALKREKQMHQTTREESARALEIALGPMKGGTTPEAFTALTKSTDEAVEKWQKAEDACRALGEDLRKTKVLLQTEQGANKLTEASLRASIERLKKEADVHQAELALGRDVARLLATPPIEAGSAFTASDVVIVHKTTMGGAYVVKLGMRREPCATLGREIIELLDSYEKSGKFARLLVERTGCTKHRVRVLSVEERKTDPSLEALSEIAKAVREGFAVGSEATHAALGQRFREGMIRAAELCTREAEGWRSHDNIVAAGAARSLSTVILSVANGAPDARVCHGPPPKKTVSREELENLNEAAWGVIANAFGGNWSQADAKWREAAERWRDRWHKTLPNLPKDTKVSDGTINFQTGEVQVQVPPQTSGQIQVTFDRQPDPPKHAPDAGGQKWVATIGLPAAGESAWGPAGTPAAMGGITEMAGVLGELTPDGRFLSFKAGARVWDRVKGRELGVLVQEADDVAQVSAVISIDPNNCARSADTRLRKAWIVKLAKPPRPGDDRGVFAVGEMTLLEPPARPSLLARFGSLMKIVGLAGLTVAWAPFGFVAWVVYELALLARAGGRGVWSRLPERRTTKRLALALLASAVMTALALAGEAAWQRRGEARAWIHRATEK